jgi:hypothetical protein
VRWHAVFAADMVSRDSRAGERDAMQGQRGRALVPFRDRVGVEFAEEGVAYLESVPRHNVVLTHQIEATRFP